MGEHILQLERHDRVALLRLNRPEAMNALSFELRAALRDALQALGDDDMVGAIVITGGEQVFAAGADLTAIKDWTYQDAL